MSKKYQEYKQLDLPEVAASVLKKWKDESVFEASVSTREGNPSFVFYEGPPSANGLPGIHHVMARAIKDIFCRYKTLKGFQVKRKAGWDTHGLPVELGVEKELGIKKEDIGVKISVEEYNKACREAVMRYTDIWNKLTEKMGYWVDMNDPYITYDPKYMESVWWLLGQLYEKNLMYKGYTIQPYSPAAGTGLSSHELNQPGCYRDVTDTTVVAQFKVKEVDKLPFATRLNPSSGGNAKAVADTFFLAWTTTPWTLPSNTALAVGPGITYVLVETYNQYTFEPVRVILAENLVSMQFGKHFSKVESAEELSSYNAGDKTIPFFIHGNCKGKDLVGLKYEQLLPFALPAEHPEQAFRVIPGSFVTTEDGTGIVHIAPTFGGDDAKVAAEAGVPAMLVDPLVKSLSLNEGLTFKLEPEAAEMFFDFWHSEDVQNKIENTDNPEQKQRYVDWHNQVKASKGASLQLDDISHAHAFRELMGPDWQAARKGFLVPLVDLTGRFRPEVGPWGGLFVKNEYYADGQAPDKSVDVQISILLKEQNRAFKVEKYVHSYPHCWRTDKPVLYYPLDSWFIRVTDVKDRMIELNNTINWKPASTGTGRFGEWLKNANDWNLSRSRYWGIPIPIWSTEDNSERICISSVEQLHAECEKSVAAGIMASNPVGGFVPGDMSNGNYAKVDLHKNYMDEVVLVSSTGKPMRRESDLIDVWFDSGSMPYAQWHYPFENKELVDKGELFPADFIAEGVDQTRGWFYTLHAIATMVFDSVAYKNVVSNGLVLDKNGQKMSKRLGNAVEPFETLDKYGPDATRWYMITNAQPWDNLKFDTDGIAEVQRKFFGTLYNTYGFLSLYGNIDGFTYAEADLPLEKRPEIDRWILSRLNSLIAEVDEAYETYEPTKAGRLIQDFVNDQLSNWYVRLCRRRFWKGDYSEDKISAYQTLYTCLEAVSIMAAPIAPFYMDRLFNDLNAVTNRHAVNSVHLAKFPVSDSSLIDSTLENQMELAQKVSSLVLGLRRKANQRVRQPLQKIMVPVLNSTFEENIKHVAPLILSEVNVKELQLLDANNTLFEKSIKPNFKTIGPKYGKQMKSIADLVTTFDQATIAGIESTGKWSNEIDGTEVVLDSGDFEIQVKDIPGWTVATEDGITVALDTTVTPELKYEGIARELVNRVQNLRKDSGFEVTDRIAITMDTSDEIREAIRRNEQYVKNEVLADSIKFDKPSVNAQEIELLEAADALLAIEKL